MKRIIPNRKSYKYYCLKIYLVISTIEALITSNEVAPIITNPQSSQRELAQFGLPIAKELKGDLILNVRSEGKHNPENKADYTGAKGIIREPKYRKMIRKQRCLVLANGFIVERMESGVAQAYLVYQRGRKTPFTMAGIWEAYQVDTQGRGKEVNIHFAVLTGPANLLMQKMGQVRAPIIIRDEDEVEWLRNDLPLSDITSMLQSFDPEDFNAYPIDPSIKNMKVFDRNRFKPIGERLMPSNRFTMKQKLELQGMGNTAARKRRDKEKLREASGAVRRTFGKKYKEEE